jgi:hypothetical protein
MRDVDLDPFCLANTFPLTMLGSAIESEPRQFVNLRAKTEFSRVRENRSSTDRAYYDTPAPLVSIVCPACPACPAQFVQPVPYRQGRRHSLRYPHHSLAYEPFWETCERLSIAVGIHEGTHTHWSCENVARGCRPQDSLGQPCSFLWVGAINPKSEIIRLSLGFTIAPQPPS